MSKKLSEERREGGRGNKRNSEERHDKHRALLMAIS